ncbi:MAG: hypothetical protein NXI16_01290 [Alphaproteobacteria bacterium]|nr:hypothetical protein [Alphaproteobacteria bacterium]
MNFEAATANAVPLVSSPDEFISNLPKEAVYPTGYHIAIAVPEFARKTKGGIHLPDEHMDRQEDSVTWGVVMGLGPDAYVECKDRSFPSGPWCKVGDIVRFRRYAGQGDFIRLSTGHKVRIMHDDQVTAIIKDASDLRLL